MLIALGRAFLWENLGRLADSFTMFMANLCVHEIYVDWNTEMSKDGTSESSPYKTIGEAVKEASEFHLKSPLRIVRINVAPGDYSEDVVVGKPTTRLALRGDSESRPSINSATFQGLGYLSLSNFTVENSLSLGN